VDAEFGREGGFLMRLKVVLDRLMSDGIFEMLS
jgi:hypothetical protein